MSDSAADAKFRLAWCIKARRDGGFWMRMPERSDYYQIGGRSGPWVQTYQQVFRWVAHL